jgi:YbbR domain-containing protein
MATIDSEGLRKRLTTVTGPLTRLRQAVDTSTLLRLLLAFLLSFGLWVYVTVRNNPETSVPLNSRLVEPRGLPSGAVLMTPLPAVDIRLTGPESLVNQPSRQPVYYIDLANVQTAAKQRVPIQVDAPPGVTATVNPSEVVVDLEPLTTASFPVTMAEIPLPAGVSMPPPSIEPSTVTASGARSTIASIARIVVRPDLTTGDATKVTRPIPLNAAGQEVTGPNLEIAPKLIQVTLPGQTFQTQKTVPVRYALQGEPASGYQINSIQTTPSVVNIVGAPETLANISALDTAPIDIAGRQQTLVQTVPLRVPTGVRAEQTEARVEIVIAPIETTVRFSLAAIPVRLGAGLRAVMAPNTVDVRLKGPVPAIRSVDVGTLRAEVDLQGYGPGTHQIAPTIKGPAVDQTGATRLEVVDVQPAKVTVQIAAEPSASPTPTVIATPPGGPQPK